MDTKTNIATRIKQAREYLRGSVAVYLGLAEWMELTADPEYLERNRGIVSYRFPRFLGIPIYRVSLVSHFNVVETKEMI